MWFLKLCLLFLTSLAMVAQPLPDAASVLKRVQERMEANCADAATNRFSYTRTNVIEEIESSGKVKKRSIKTYEVALAQGLPRARLVAIDGRRLSESEQRWRISEEQRLQRTLTQDKAPDYQKPKPWLTDDILQRFTFTLAGRTNYLRRPALILKFQPRADAPARNMADRVVNKVNGALWVDEEEAEIARLQIGMSEPVKFWGGILGQLDKFDWSMQRSRSPMGVWFNQLSSGMVQIRKLFATTRFQISEEASGFARAEP